MRRAMPKRISLEQKSVLGAIQIALLNPKLSPQSHSQSLSPCTSKSYISLGNPGKYSSQGGIILILQFSADTKDLHFL